MAIFGPTPVVDSNGDPQENATVRVYAATDTALTTPLTVRDLTTGQNVVDLQSNAHGLLHFDTLSSNIVSVLVKPPNHPAQSMVSGAGLQQIADSVYGPSDTQVDAAITRAITDGRIPSPATVNALADDVAGLGEAVDRKAETATVDAALADLDTQIAAMTTVLDGKAADGHSHEPEDVSAVGTATGLRIDYIDAGTRTPAQFLPTDRTGNRLLIVRRTQGA